MTIRIGYLLPTREKIMAGEPQTAPLLALADRAESLGYDSLWIGDSLVARPRHEPLAMLAAIAGRTSRMALGTAVLLPILRNPVLLAHQVATLDQLSEGRLILGIGSGNDQPDIRDEFDAAGVPFEKRIGRMLEGLRLCKALWTGEPVEWDGRWRVHGETLGPVPYREGGPPIWGGGGAAGALQRAGRYYDGWFPSGPSDPAVWQARWQELCGYATAAGRAPDDIVGGMYLTLAIDDDADRAEAELNDYLERYYKRPAEILRKTAAGYAGDAAGALDWMQNFVNVGVTHFVLRFTGDHERNMETAIALREKLDPAS